MSARTLIQAYSSGLKQRKKKSLVIPKACLLIIALVAVGVLSIMVAVDTVMSIYKQDQVINSDTITENVDSTDDDKKTDSNIKIRTRTYAISMSHEKTRFAYAFLVAGVKPESPTYKGYIYNIAIAREILSSHDSKADIVAMIRMHIDTDKTRLPPEHEAILTNMGIIVKYIPKPLSDNFHTAMMDKFRILEMTEYERVIYLDADIIPLQNLDYVFENSVGPNATVQENVVLAYHLEPSNGGFFMLKPDKDDYVLLTQIIEKREMEGYDFNETIGWGHVITPPDYWESFTEKKTSWTFYGAFTDQGLLYYWTKYVKKQVTIICGKEAKTWKEKKTNGQVELVDVKPISDVFSNANFAAVVKPVHRKAYLLQVPPYQHFHHFVQKLKPWLMEKYSNSSNIPDYVDVPKNVYELWFNTLRDIEEKYKLGIDITDIYSGKKSTLGNFPAKSMVMWAKRRREENAKSLNSTVTLTKR